MPDTCSWSILPRRVVCILGLVSLVLVTRGAAQVPRPGRSGPAAPDAQRGPGAAPQPARSSSSSFGRSLSESGLTQDQVRRASAPRDIPTTCSTAISPAPTPPRRSARARDARGDPLARHHEHRGGRLAPLSPTRSMAVSDSVRQCSTLCVCSRPIRSGPTPWPIRSRVLARRGLKDLRARDLPPNLDHASSRRRPAGGRELPARPGRRARPDPHRRRRAGRTTSR